MKTSIEHPLFVAAKTKQQAIRDYAEVAKVVKVSGGYMLFPYMHQYQEWKNSK